MNTKQFITGAGDRTVHYWSIGCQQSEPRVSNSLISQGNKDSRLTWAWTVWMSSESKVKKLIVSVSLIGEVELANVWLERGFLGAMREQNAMNMKRGAARLPTIPLVDIHNGCVANHRWAAIWYQNTGTLHRIYTQVHVFSCLDEAAHLAASSTTTQIL